MGNCMKKKKSIFFFLSRSLFIPPMFNEAFALFLLSVYSALWRESIWKRSARNTHKFLCYILPLFTPVGILFYSYEACFKGEIVLPENTHNLTAVPTPYLHNPSQPSTTLHNPSQPFTTLHNPSQPFTTLHNPLQTNVKRHHASNLPKRRVGVFVKMCD